jgi:dolichol-phosphate mannosyltransferase
MKLTVVLPAFNEAENIEELIRKIGSTLASTNFLHTILIVDDGSSDSTGEIARAQAAHWPVEVISHEVNRGLGAAIQTGLTHASLSDGVIVTMDADNSHDPNLIPLMVKRLGEGNDVVIASRYQKGAEIHGVPLHRRALSRGVLIGMGMLLRIKNVRDYSCGYRAYRSSSIRDLRAAFGDDFVTEKGFACMVELLIKLRQIGARAVEVPMILRYDLKKGQSKMRVFRTMARYLALITGSSSPRTGSVVSVGRIPVTR